MKIQEAHSYAIKEATERGLTWDGDNRVFVIEVLLPILPVRDNTRRIIRWAYGYDGSDRSYEQESDGSSVVKDWFMLGLIKEPPGVGHDYINRVNEHTTPDGHKWTPMQSIFWYYKAMRDFGYARVHAAIRFVGLAITVPFWWG